LSRTYLIVDYSFTIFLQTHPHPTDEAIFTETAGKYKIKKINYALQIKIFYCYENQSGT
jgi:hypothetical protein